jgi:hypothetical protein
MRRTLPLLSTRVLALLLAGGVALVALGLILGLMAASPAFAKAAKPKIDENLSSCPGEYVDSGTEVTFTVTTTPEGLDYEYSVRDESGGDIVWTRAEAGTPLVVATDGGTDGNTYTVLVRAVRGSHRGPGEGCTFYVNPVEPVLDAHNPEQWQDEWTSISMGSNSQVGYSPPTWNAQKFVALNTGVLTQAKLVAMYGFTADQEVNLPVRFYHVPLAGTPELLAESTVRSNNQHDFDVGYPLTAEPINFAGAAPHVQAGETYAIAWRDGAARCVRPTVATNQFTGMVLDDTGNFVEWRTDADGFCGSSIFATYVVPD